MNIDDLKHELKKVRAPKMEIGTPGEFFERLKAQDRKDERWLLNKRIVPLLIGLIIFIVIVLPFSFVTPMMFVGCLLIMFGLSVTLILSFIDYKDISREAFHSSIEDFLKQKMKRLSYWRSTHFKYHVLFSFFLIGWLMVNYGNKNFVKVFGEFPFILFLGPLLVIMIVSHILGEIRFRRRFENEHRPILDMIDEMQNQ
jgi:UDP-N-acetylmuramyl pentapeptide phosphotransferase/UDP-N-acetylglucosamine-1-phosphate transferase